MTQSLKSQHVSFLSQTKSTHSEPQSVQRWPGQYAGHNALERVFHFLIFYLLHTPGRTKYVVLLSVCSMSFMKRSNIYLSRRGNLLLSFCTFPSFVLSQIGTHLYKNTRNCKDPFFVWPDLIFVTNITNYIRGEKLSCGKISAFHV